MRTRLTGIKSAVIVDDYLFCVPLSFSGLHKISLLDWSVHYVCEIPFKDCSADVFYLNGSIWCVPDRGVQVFQYVLLTGETRNFVLEKENGLGNSRENLCAILLYGNLWILPKYVPGELYKFELEEQKFTVDLSWMNELEEKEVSGRFCTFCLDNTDVYIVIYSTKSILKYNLDTSQAQKYQLPVSDNLFCITKYKQSFCVTTENTKKLICWNQNENKVDEYSSNDNIKGYYVRALTLKDFILLLEGESIDIFDGKNIEGFISEGLESSNASGSLFITCVNYEGMFLLIPYNSNMFVVLDKYLNVIKLCILNVTIEEELMKTQTIYEGDFSLQEFINLVKNRNSNITMDNNKSGYSTGVEIYTTVIREK